MGLKGTPTPNLVAENSSYNWSSGWTNIQVWEGGLDELREQATQAIDNPPSGTTSPSDVKIDRIEGSPHYRMTMSWTGGEGTGPGTSDPDPINTFELLDNQLQQPTKSNSILDSLLYTTESTIKFISDIHRGATIKDAYPDEQAALDAVDSIAGYTTEQRTLAKTFLAHLFNGVDTFINFHYVLRRTITVVDPSQVIAAFEGIKGVWTTGDLILRELAGFNDLLFFASLQDNLPTVQWLKIPPNVTAAAGQRMQIAYEYWGADEWSTLYYPTYTIA